MIEDSNQLNRNEETFLDKVIKYKSVFSVVVGVSIAFGVILVFLYCFF